MHLIAKLKLHAFYHKIKFFGQSCFPLSGQSTNIFIKYILTKSIKSHSKRKFFLKLTHIDMRINLLDKFLVHQDHLVTIF